MSPQMEVLPLVRVLAQVWGYLDKRVRVEVQGTLHAMPLMLVRCVQKQRSCLHWKRRYPNTQSVPGDSIPLKHLQAVEQSKPSHREDPVLPPSSPKYDLPAASFHAQVHCLRPHPPASQKAPQYEKPAAKQAYPYSSPIDSASFSSSRRTQATSTHGIDRKCPAEKWVRFATAGIDLVSP
ncbi:hypothetical protein BJX70DRAFT_362608 [Aspergillus crustosus]